MNFQLLFFSLLQLKSLEILSVFLLKTVVRLLD